MTLELTSGGDHIQELLVHIKNFNETEVDATQDKIKSKNILQTFTSFPEFSILFGQTRDYSAMANPTFMSLT